MTQRHYALGVCCVSVIGGDGVTTTTRDSILFAIVIRLSDIDVSTA